MIDGRRFVCVMTACSVSYISAADVAAWQTGRCNDAVTSSAALTTATHLLPSPVE